MAFVDEEAMFFGPSQEGDQRLGYFYTLRRDIDQCLGFDPNTGAPWKEHRVLWPGAMAIMAAYDLLAKFYAGDDASGRGGDRFKRFLMEFACGLTQGQEEIIYQLRNSLLHSFGLYSKSGKVGSSDFKEYCFVLTIGKGSLILEADQNRYVVNIHSLRVHLDAAVAAFRARLAVEPGLQTNFSKMFRNYGCFQRVLVQLPR